MLSRWENAHAMPDEIYRRYLCAALDVDEHELGLTPDSRAGGVAGALGSDSSCAYLIEHVRRVMGELVAADNELGSGVVLEAAEAEAGLLVAMAKDVRGAARPETLMLASRFVEFCGWLRQDAADLDAAQRWSSLALELAEELGDPTQLSYVLMRKSNLLVDAGEPRRALGLADAALRAGRRPLTSDAGGRTASAGHGPGGHVRAGRLHGGSGRGSIGGPAGRGLRRARGLCQCAVHRLGGGRVPRAAGASRTSVCPSSARH